jgi:hypothetical protein
MLVKMRESLVACKSPDEFSLSFEGNISSPHVLFDTHAKLARDPSEESTTVSSADADAELEPADWIFSR